MDFWMKMIKREFDTKPIACHLYVTDQCNLDCFYCTEYDNYNVPRKLDRSLR
jgi:molybdenum cofactor biosynthesis enzyme MoaA